MEGASGDADAVHGAVLGRRGPGWPTFAGLFLAYVVGIEIAATRESFWPVVVPALVSLAVAIRSLFGAPRLLKGNVAVTPDHVEVGGVRLTRRALIEDAHVVPGTDKNSAHVCLRRRWGLPPIEVHVGSIANGRRLLQALGMDPRQKTQTFTVHATSQRHFMARHLLFMAFTLSLAAFGVLNDFAYARLAGAADSMRLPERAGRSGAQWLADLKKVATRSGYRDEAAPDEAALFRVVEDPAKNAEMRAAAAVALASSVDDIGKKRLRIAAEASAAPKLRVTLEAAADNDDRALAEALEALEEDTKQSAPARERRPRT